MPAAAPTPMWQGKYPMTDPTHADDLQMRSDINEHMYRMPRAQAEAKAHADYRLDQVREAAAHHWVGMKASAAAGNQESAKKHGLQYALAMHQLGHKDLLTPPDEVVSIAEKTPSKEIGGFKGHAADAFTTPPVDPDELKKGEDDPTFQAIRWMIRKHAIRRGLIKAEDVTDEYPASHKLGMVVPEGGSSCASCGFVSEDLKKCGNEVFREWNGRAELPAPADKYCCDLYKIGDEK